MRYLYLTVVFIWLGAEASNFAIILCAWFIFWFWIMAESLSQLFRKEA
jgi:hypothetical protein